MADLAQLEIRIRSVEAEVAAGRLERLRRESVEVERQTQRASDRFDTQARTTGRLSDSLRDLGRNLGALAAGFVAFQTVRTITDDVADFERRLVGVGKTTDLEGAALARLGEDIEGLGFELRAIPTEELLDVSQAAGQLGVSGSENILNFAETVGRLGTSTDLAGDRAATTLARLLAVTGENVASVNVLGAQIVDLGNNFAATESEIAAVAQRVAQSTAIYGVGSGEALAYGAALKTVGVEAELAGTSLGKTFRAIDQAVRAGGDSLARFAEVAGVSSERFAKAYGDDANQAFLLFLRGLGRTEREGGDIARTIEELGLEGERLIQVLGPLAQRSDLVADALARQAAQAANATALEAESAKGAETLSASFQRLSNAISAASNAAGDGGYRGTLKGVVDVSAETIAILSGVRGAYENSSDAGRAAAETLDALIDGSLAFAAVGLGRIIIGGVRSLGALATSLTAVTVSQDVYTGAVTRTNTALAATSALARANPFLLIASGVSALVAVLSLLDDDLEETNEGVAEISAEVAALDQQIARLRRIRVEIDRADEVSDLAAQVQAAREQIQTLQTVSNDLRVSAAVDLDQSNVQSYFERLEAIREQLLEATPSFAREVTEAVARSRRELDRLFEEGLLTQEEFDREVERLRFTGSPFEIPVTFTELDKARAELDDLIEARNRYLDQFGEGIGSLALGGEPVDIVDTSPEGERRREVIAQANAEIQNQRELIAALQREASGVNIAETAERIRQEAVAAVEAAIVEGRAELQRLEADLEAERERQRQNGPQPGRDFVDNLAQERERIEAVSEAERRRVEIIQERDRIISRERLEGADRADFVRRVEEEVVALEQAIEVSERRVEVERRITEARGSFDEIRRTVEQEIESLETQIRSRTESKTAIEEEVAVRRVLQAAQDAGATVGVAEAASVEQLIRLRRTLREEVQRQAVEESIQRSIETSEREIRIVEESSRILRENSEASLSLSEARRIATESTRIFLEGEAEGLENARDLATAYELVAIRAESAKRAQREALNERSPRREREGADERFERGIEAEIRALQAYGLERIRVIELTRLQEERERELTDEIRAGRLSAAEAVDELSESLERANSRLTELERIRLLSTLFEAVGDSGARAMADIFTGALNAREALATLIETLQRVAVEEAFVQPVRGLISGGLQSVFSAVSGGGEGEDETGALGDAAFAGAVAQFTVAVGLFQAAVLQMSVANVSGFVSSATAAGTGGGAIGAIGAIPNVGQEGFAVGLDGRIRAASAFELGAVLSPGAGRETPAVPSLFEWGGTQGGFRSRAVARPRAFVDGGVLDDGAAGDPVERSSMDFVKAEFNRRGSFAGARSLSNSIVEETTLFEMAEGRIGVVGEGMLPEGIFPLAPDGRGTNGVQARVRTADGQARDEVLSVARLPSGDLGVVLDLGEIEGRSDRFEFGGTLAGRRRVDAFEAGGILSSSPERPAPALASTFASGGSVVSSTSREVPLERFTPARGRDERSAPGSDRRRDGSQGGDLGGGTGDTIEESGRGDALRRAQSISVNLQQRIVAPDPNAFRKSDRQIAADMQRALRRAVR